MLSFSTHASQECVTTGLIADQYNPSFDLLDSNLQLCQQKVVSMQIPYG
jgi:hypothetical protein